MSNLYKDAIADARKLREAAEQNAKNRIIDAVTPKLRRLIEKQILEGDEFVSDDEFDELIDAPEALDMMDDESDYEPPAPEPMELSPAPMDVDSDGLASIEVIPDDEEEDSADGDSNKSVHVNITVEGKRNYLLRHRAIRLVKALSEAKTRSKRNKIRKELVILREALIITENSQNIRLAKNIKVILKESTMRRRKNSWLFEGKEGAAGEEVEFDDAGFEEGDVDVDAIKDAVADLAAAVGMEASDEEGEDLDMEDDELDMDDDDLDLDMEDDDLGDEGVGYEYGGVSEADDDEDEDELNEADGDECNEADDDDDDEEVVEVNEAMLRRALGAARRRRPTSRRRNRRLSETARARRARIARRRRNLREGEAKAMASSFGGGKLGKEMFVDVDENTLLNALAEELGGHANSTNAKGKASAKASDFGGGSIKKGGVMEARRRRATARKLQEAKRQVAKAARIAKATKKELNESNLFNAKLLYVTKLMQQHTLNNKQQRAIIEAMDNAKTQREAKLLFTSLNESLNKRAASKGNKLNENKSRTGSSSRSLRSGQAPSKSGVELDRWAVLAGIKK